MSDAIKGIVQLVFVCVFIGVSIFISSMLQSSDRPEKQSETKERSLFVSTQSVSSEPYRISFETTGTVQARAQINITPQISGRVTEVNQNFFEGGLFKADEVLFKIEPLDFELEVQRLSAEVARARTAFNIEQAESKAATEEWKLINGNKKVPSLVARKPQIDEAWANLKAAKAQLENAKLDLDRASFSLPFDGRVLSSTLEQGQFVTAGQSYGSVFDVAGLEVRASLEDQQLEWLMNSKTPKIKIMANYLGQSKTFEGMLKRSASALDPQTRFAAVNFGFKDKNPDLLPGIFATLRITGDPMSGIVKLPSSALQKEGLIWTLNNDDTLRSVNPDIVYATKDYVAVRGIDDQTIIVTSRVSGATEGMKVKQSDDENSDQKNENSPPQNNALEAETNGG